MTGGVYVLEMEKGIYKIGISANIKKRHSEHNGWYGKKLLLIKTWVLSESDAWRTEQAAKNILHKYRTKKYGGIETYQASKTRVIKAIRTARKAALKSEKTIRGAARLIGCKPITIIRRQQAGRATYHALAEQAAGAMEADANV